jgi:hypothetical protein
MSSSTDHIFQPLIAAHDFISSRLLNFFNNDDFADAEFSVNEFDVFAMFFATIAFLNNKEPSEDLGAVIEDFHTSLIAVIVQRILAAHPEEARAEKKVALTGMIKKIFEERFRHYFHIFNERSSEDSKHIYTRLADAFLDNAVKETGHQETLSRFTPFITELFNEVIVFLEKTEPLAHF